MKIREVLAAVDERYENSISEEEKIKWLADLDHRIKLEVIDQYEGAEDVFFERYTQDTSTGRELLVPAPYDELYIFHLAARIHYANEEMTRYNNATVMFNEVFENFRKQYHRTHRAKPVKIKFF